MDPRILILVISCIITITSAAPQKYTNSVQEPPTKEKEATQVKILKQINKVNPDGSYTYGYEADDGSFKVETRSREGVVKGKYGFVENGQLKTIEYTAGEKGPDTPADSDDEEEDQKHAAQTPSAKTVTVVTAKNKPEPAAATDDDGPSSNEDYTDGKTQNDDDFGSFGAQQQRQGQVIQGRPSYLGGGGGFNGGPSPYSGGPQYIPSSQYLGGGGGGSPLQFQQEQQFQGQQFQGQSPFGGFQPSGGQSFNPQFQYQGQPQLYSQQPQSQQLGRFQGGQPQQFVGGQPGGFRGQSFDGLSGGGQFNGPTSTGFPIVSSQGGQGGNVLGVGQAGQFTGGQALRGGQVGPDGEYVPNVELDGFSDDQDQDGFVDTFPGSGSGSAASGGQPLGAVRSAQAEGAEKAPVVKTPSGVTRLSAGPQSGGLRIQNNPSLQGIQGGGPGGPGGVAGSPIYFNGPQSINGQFQGGQPQQFVGGQPGQLGQLSDEQIQALYQFQGQPGFQGVTQGGGRPGIPQSPFGGQGVNGQQFSQFNNPTQFQGGQGQFSPQGFPISQQQPQGFSPQQFGPGGVGPSGQFGPGGAVQQFSSGPQQQQSQGIPIGGQGLNQGSGLVQIQGGQFSPSSPSSGGGVNGGFTSAGPSSQFSSPQSTGGGIPFGAISNGGQQFAPVQNFLPQGVQQQGGQIPPQFLQQGGQTFSPQQQQGGAGQSFSPQQGGGGSLQSPGFPFDYNPYAGGPGGPYAGGPGGAFPGQFGGGGAYPGQFSGVVPGGVQPGQISSQGPQTYLLGGQQQRAVVSSPSSAGGAAASSPKTVAESTESKDKKSA